METQPFFFDRQKLRALAEAHAAEYQNNEPFPHIVIDSFLPEDVAQKVLEEFPGPDASLWQQKFENKDTEYLKLSCEDDTRMPAFTRELLAQFNSSALCEFVEVVTGIKGIIPDPHFRGGGLHQTLRGGKLGIHIDFNRYKRLSLNRRVNILLYLNKDWHETYGGDLELWDRDMKTCIKKVPPIFNRMAMFSTTGYSYHGHPDPLSCPSDRTRKSLALYYYTTEVGDKETEIPHTTLFQKRPGERSTHLTVDFLKELVPPILVKAARRLRQESKNK